MKQEASTSPLDSSFVRYARAVVRWRYPVALAAIAAVGLLAAGGAFVKMDNNYRYFFREDNPELQAFEELQDTYSKNDNILVVIETTGGDAFAPAVLDATEKLTAALWKTPFATRVDSVTNFQHSYAEGDDLVVEELVEGATELSSEELNDARAAALAEPLLRSRLVSPAGDVTAINVTLELPGQTAGEETPAVEYVRALARAIEADYAGIDVHLTGIVMLNHAFFEASMQDMTTLVPLMYLVLVIVLVLLLRSVTSTVGAMVIVALSVAAAMGIAGWAGIPITAPSSTAPTMILTLAIADSIHILVTLLQKMRDEGMSKNDALVESLRVNLGPVFLTSLTTAIGFLTLNFSDVRPFNDLGNITAAGVGIAFLLSVTLLPALVAILPIRVHSVRRRRESTSMQALADWVIRRRGPVLIASGLALLSAGAFVPANTLNDQFVEYFAESFEFRRDTDFTTNNLTGIYTLDFSLGAGEPGGVAEPAYLTTLDEFASWYRAQPGVVHVNTLSDTMRRLNKNMHADEASAYRLPQTRELAAQYLVLYEMSLPYGLDLNNQVNIDKSATRLTVTTDNLTTADLRTLAQRGERWLSDNAPAAMHARASSPGLMFAYISGRNIDSMLLGTLVAMLLISGILVVALRSLTFGAVSIVPNVVPAIAAFGLWGLGVGEINLGLSMVAAVSLGIIVDDTVHFLSKYLRVRRERGVDAPTAVRYAFSSVGRALVVTTAVLIAGFGVLSLSPFGLNGGMGQLTALTLAIALATDLLFLPTLLLFVDGRKIRDVATATRAPTSIRDAA